MKILINSIYKFNYFTIVVLLVPKYLKGAFLIMLKFCNEIF